MNTIKKLKIGMLIFPELTVLDFIGPYDVFIRASCFEVYIVSAHQGPIKAEGGLKLFADYTFNDCPDVDILFVPGGRGVTALLTDNVYHTFLRKQAVQAQYITSVCTGSLLLAAAGLLTGFKATTHWRSLDLLRMLGVEALEERVVVDGNRITGGGITAGIDFALVLTAKAGGEAMAKTIQLALEYNPEPPYQSGNPTDAEPYILRLALDSTQAVYDLRKKIITEMIAEGRPK